MSSLRLIVLGIVGIVAIWDLAVGAYLLASPSPWRAHGPGTLWSDTALLTVLPPVMSLYRRLGAFSLHAGAMALVFAAIGHRHRPTLTALLFGYAITGLGFFATDTAYFKGTPYYVIKQVFGALWTLAIVLHLVEGRRRA